jgi:hypothetical protein
MDATERAALGGLVLALTDDSTPHRTNAIAMHPWRISHVTENASSSDLVV